MSPAKVLNKWGKEVAVGDTVTNFRGETGTFQGITRMPEGVRTAKIQVDGREFYSHVYDLYVEELNDNA